MHINFKWIIIILVALTSCKASTESKKIKEGLDEASMKIRSESLSNVSYKLYLDIGAVKDKFSGNVNTQFTITKIPKILRVDFHKGHIFKVTANGSTVKKINYNGQFLLIPGELLKLGANELIIDFQRKYNANGEGFNRFKDPEDGRSYVYTNFEPFNANQLFPNFDQPNLKATYELRVLAPISWQVISSVLENNKSTKGKKTLWTFPITQRFSTYVFNVTAGPFAVWNSIYKNKSRSIPLRLFTRKSLAKYMDHENWFKLTKQGFKFFEDYFDYEYPFTKYDQTTVPDFNYGGMENVGAVTFNEKYLFRSPPTNSRREDRAYIIMHEMAHMWFGDLVTMNWWNDLWLNESFATIMGYHALAEATEFKQAWTTFNYADKDWAYWSDQLVTTHPIEVPVNDTKTAFTNFDGITYGKGASVLKQLMYLLGNDFKIGLRNYFKMYAYKNTELSDFFRAIEKASDTDLSSWIEEWIRKAGLNSVAANYQCNNGKITDFSLIQTAPKDHKTLRTHKTKLALFSLTNKNKLKLYKVEPVTYNGGETKVEPLINVACPDLVYSNYEDEDYVKVVLDKRSLKALNSGIGSIEHKLTRLMAWKTIWDMVEYDNYPLNKYLNLVLKNIKQEDDNKIKTYLLYQIYNRSLWYLKQDHKNKSAHHKTSLILENLAWERLVAAKANSEAQKEWYNNVIRSTHSKPGLQRLSKLLNGKIKIKGLKINQDKRWDLIISLNRYNAPGSLQLIANEKKADPSEQGIRAAIAAETSRPDIEIKRLWFDRITADKPDLKFSHYRVAMRNLFPVDQINLQREFAEESLSRLLQLVDKRDSHFFKEYASNIIPLFCDQQSSQLLSQFIKDNKDLSIQVIKPLRIENHNNKRCRQIIDSIDL